MSDSVKRLQDAHKKRFGIEAVFYYDGRWGWMWHLPEHPYPQRIGHDIDEALDRVRTSQALAILVDDLCNTTPGNRPQPGEGAGKVGL